MGRCLGVVSGSNVDTMKIIFFLNLRAQQMKTGGYLHRVQVDVAECAYKLKWNNHIEESKCDSSDNPPD